MYVVMLNMPGYLPSMTLECDTIADVRCALEEERKHGEDAELEFNEWQDLKSLTDDELDAAIDFEFIYGQFSDENLLMAVQSYDE